MLVYDLKLMEKVRISKLMAQRGICSRREADAYLERGLVQVDGQTAVVGERAFEHQTITLLKSGQSEQSSRVTILIHKPMGIVSGQAEDGYQPAVSLINHTSQSSKDRSGMKFNRTHLNGLAVAGRLDIDSTGLLVLTQDGRIARTLIGEQSLIEKEYLVRVDGRLSDQDLKRLNHGLSLDGRALKPAKVSWLNQDQLKFVLQEGRKRQIRRMCEMVGLKVVGLKRVRIGNIQLADLEPGCWRYLRPDESF